MINQVVYMTDGFWREMGDQRVHSKYPLMSGGPVPVIAIVSLYVYFVRVLGPKFMKTRQAYDLKWTIRVYNILMSFINVVAFYKVALITRCGLNYFGCKQVGHTQRDNELVDLAFLYFSSKLVELLDTIFFILRKKDAQASNLHVFHHSFIAICVWVFFKIAPGGSSVMFPFLNAGVHSIMYFYYFLATFEQAKPYLWWKRHLTALQIFQFVLSMVHFSFQGLSSCEYPIPLAVIGFSFNLVFLMLFLDFYNQAYLKKTANKGHSKKLDDANKTTKTSAVKTTSGLKRLSSISDISRDSAISNETTLTDSISSTWKPPSLTPTTPRTRQRSKLLLD